MVLGEIPAWIVIYPLQYPWKFSKFVTTFQILVSFYPVHITHV